jgi:LuxR family maltose regulon positive regulatory protein
MTSEAKAITLIRTKLQRPRLPGDLIPRRRLLDRLHAGSDRKLTLISAMAGSGKTTLLVQWLDECTQPSAWLSLDEHDNDRIAFLTYLCEAIRTVFPTGCDKALSLLHAPQTPSAREITALIANEFAALFASPSPKGLILALDDFHHITDPAIHQIVAGLIEHLPQGVHLALATRADPQLPLARLRARRAVTEIRSEDLRFTSVEAHAFLEGTTGRKLNPEITHLLEKKTEGWVVGLRLVSLSMGTRSDQGVFVQSFKGTDSNLIVEYLLSEVLARQSAEIQDFVLRTSVLDRFCAPLCEALTGVSAARSQEIIEWITRANLFLVPLDVEDNWYRYHHLFRDLLRHELSQQVSALEISDLHARAGAWFARNESIDEALDHFLVAGDTAAAVALVARHRYALMNGVEWPRLDRYLHQFAPDILDQYPDLLMLQTWLLYHRGRWAELPAALQRLEAAMSQGSLPPQTVTHLQGEIGALRSLLYYHALEPERALASAQEALVKTPREVWIVRTLARLFLAGVLQMKGNANQAYDAIYDAFEEEESQSDAFKATLVMTVCWVHSVQANLQGMAQAASQCIALSQRARIPQILNYGHYHLGRVYYHRNDLAAAEEHFKTIVQQPYLNYGNCFAYAACGLALIYQVQDQPDKAQAVIEGASMFLLETGNTTLMPVIQAFQAELALRQGRIARASQWADHLDPVPPLVPMTEPFSPHLTLVKVLLAQDTPASRQQAADLLDQLREFVESTHNKRHLIEVLVFQALLQERQGKRQSALELLGRAVALAEPGGFIRLFVDPGYSQAPLLHQLRQQGLAPDYLSQVLAAFPEPDLENGKVGRQESKIQVLVEPLTPRELEVLALLGRHLTNKEIAAELVISPDTVKSHTMSIYRKLDVGKRQQAVARARELGLLSSIR